MVECEVNGDVLRGNDGLPFGMVYIIRDMTDKKKLQAQLLQSQKMEAIGRLAGGVAHDYNNMLGVILGYATLLAAEIPAGMPAQSKVKSIIAAAERSADLTKQLLAFSRQQIIAPIVLNLHDELLALNRMVGRLIGEDVTLSVNRHGALWNTKIDPTQFTQLITNLAANARDAIVNTGTITIDLKNVRITKPREAGYGDVPPGEYVLLSFSDSGCGMDEATVQQIFEPFFTTKPPGKGTGLGLATVFGIVTQNDGYINVSSRIGEGTTFDVYFPRVTADAALPAAAAEEADLRGTETIIVVEDEKELLALTMNTLQVQGYTVIGACDSAEALSLVDHFTGRVDILVTDVIMPGMNGKELKERLEMRYPSIKTLFISGYTSDIVANRGVLGEGMDFLQKPFSAPGLLTKIRQMANAT
jgi:nitrogen-specific signal transduction histidine kinase/CheY-like chemotaxis protein